MNTQCSKESTIEEQLNEALIQEFDPVHLDVQNKSHLHLGHAGDNGSGQTHFQLTIVSDRFVEQPKVARHRSVNSSVEHLFNSGLHALEMRIFTESEWNMKSGLVDE